MRFHRLILFFFLTSVFFISCVKDDFDFDKIKSPTWQPGVAVPLVGSSLTLENVISKTGNTQFGSFDGNNFCTLIYSKDLYSVGAEDFFQLPKLQNNKSIVIDPIISSQINNIGTITFNAEEYISIPANINATIDSIEFKGGQLEFTASSDFKHHIVMDVTIPGATKNGVAFNKIINLTYNGQVPVSKTISVSLAGYNFNLHKGSQIGKIQIKYKITATATGNPVSGSEVISMALEMDNMKFSRAFGYFGVNSIGSGLDTIPVELLKDGQSIGGFSVDDPKFILKLSNSFGIPTRVDVPSIKSLGGTGNSINLATSLPIPLSLPSPGMNQIGETLYTQYVLDKTNSNIVPFVENNPTHILYNVMIGTNPNGPTANFITDQSKISASLTMELPLNGSIKDFSMIDTVDFELKDEEMIESLLLRMSFKNGFPIEFGSKIYFIDANNSVVDSLLCDQPQLISSANVNSAGVVVSSVQKTTDVLVDRSFVNRIAKAKRIVYILNSSTANQGNSHVKIYGHYKMDVNIGAIAKLKVTP
ncbi:MAG TPA: hypothetical protein PKH65_04750 [Bacteroidia bacterium]|nr:hypothetical protein [Bacteroidia bacterium]HNT79970.1 hypothetical protein [Bacteroidia bacterium]